MSVALTAAPAAHAGEPEATDDAALVEETGGTIVFVPGALRNLKITARDDLMLAEAWLR